MAHLAPPGETSSVVCRRVLVIAPHYDDEVLGCGGLLGLLSESAEQLRVLFLSDGSGGVEDVEERAAYVQTRRNEADEAARVLGVTEVEQLDLPDGALDQHVPRLCEAMADALLRGEPDLVLVPSPLEVTVDHRTAFAALHEVLRGVRRGDALWPVVESLTVLVYEVNHPAYPDLLVDASGQRELLERAMACYASQQARHDYLAAALGLRRYRTLSLAPSVELAEGYRRLSAADFATRSPSQLIRHLGGVPELLEIAEGPLVSVVVRTRDRPELLAQALGSLAASRYRRLEVVLVNDGGRKPELPAGFPFAVKRVDLAENRGRAEAANAGVAAASGELVAFLDDDDLVSPEHYATLVEAAQAADVQVVYSDAAVGVYELGGGRGWTLRERRLPYSRDFDPDLLLVDNYIPFNTLLIPRGLFDEVGPFDADFPFFEDWDFLIRLAQRLPFHHVPRATCEYRHFEGGASDHVLAGGARRRSGFRADFLRVKARLLAKHTALIAPESLAAAVDRLRREQVEASEETRQARLRLRELAEEAAVHRQDFHRLNGEVVSLREERERLLADLRAGGELQREQERRIRDREDRLAEQNVELERLFREEKELRATVESQGRDLEHLYRENERAYAEIERLAALVARYQSSPVARLQRFGRRLLGRGA